MIGEKALGAKLAAKLDGYAATWRERVVEIQTATSKDRTLRVDHEHLQALAVGAAVMSLIAGAIREVTQ